MAIKAVIFTDPECKKPCDDAIESMAEYIAKGEMEVMEISEAIRQGYDLGEPEGVPFIGFISESSKKCLTRSFFHDEEGKITLQRYGAEVEGEPRKLSEQISHIDLGKGEETLEASEE
ncbi:unnamed protein product [marine sediment metagenome]|uniref:Uncharacterized protein n=1 Tax=marine sediment metagenome TaxID=412755 RepID=X1K185_9ZZZZ